MATTYRKEGVLEGIASWASIRTPNTNFQEHYYTIDLAISPNCFLFNCIIYLFIVIVIVLI